MRDCPKVDSWTPYLVNDETERKQELRSEKKNYAIGLFFHVENR